MTFAYPVSSNAAHPPRLSPGYRSTLKRAPHKPLIPMRQTLSELTGPVYGHEAGRANDHDLTTQHKGEPLGERIIVHGHVQDEDGRGVPNALIELWQENACGRHHHVWGPHSAPAAPDLSSRAAGPELYRRRPHAIGCQRLLPVHHGKTRRLPGGQSPQCVAAGAYPFL